MTKEELEKEATDYALEWGDKTDGTYACCRDGYLAGAEPREKRIAELEKELEFEKSVNGEFTAIEKLRELEKENAELKEKLKPENCLKSLAKSGFVKFTCENGNEHDQLTKAKELLEDFICYANLADCNLYIKEQAEQFLKDSEVEK